MKTCILFLLLTLLLSGKITFAQDDHYSVDSISVYYEKCLVNTPENSTKDNDFFCLCSTNRVVAFFTISEVQNLTTSSPKGFLIARCEEMANEFGDKPVRSEELEWAFIMIDANTEVKLTGDGVYYIVNNPGTGPKPLPGQTVVIECELALPSAQDYIFSTIKDGTPLTFEIGKNTMITGLELGVQLFGKGGEGFIYFPPELGYGSSDRGEQLPANSVLMCHIKILEIK